MINQFTNDIIKVVKQYNGIIVGSYALHIFNPLQNFNDIDIISSNPNKLAEYITVVLNKKYGTGRFNIVKSYNAIRIYDTKQSKYIVDVTRYPISKNNYTIVNGLKVANPEFVMRGKDKQYVGRKIFRSVGMPRINIRKFL